MAHRLIVGMTGCGKTTLAKQFEAAYIARGGSCLIYDPIGAKWQSPKRHRFRNIEKFCRVAEKSKNCLLIVDESGEAIGRHAGDLLWLGTRSRHKGHELIIITQRPSSVDRDVRDQCAKLSCFMLSEYDARNLAREFPQMGLDNIPIYQIGEYRQGSKFGPGKTFNVFTKKEIEERTMPGTEKDEKKKPSEKLTKEVNNAKDKKCSNLQQSENDTKPKQEGVKNEPEKHRYQHSNSNNSNGDQREIPRQKNRLDIEADPDPDDDDVVLMFQNFEEEDEEE